MMAAVLYARFSPRQGELESESNEAQLSQMRRWCADNRLPVKADEQDKAKSGSDASRPGLWSAISALEKGDILVVRSCDRLARDVMLSEWIRWEVRKRGATIVALEGGEERPGAEAVLIRQILSAVHEYNRKVTAARTQTMMREHQRNGKRMSGETPFGFRVDEDNPDMLIQDADEYNTVQDIVYWHKNHCTLRYIARRLNDEGRPARGGKWHHSLVRAILVREGLLDPPKKRTKSSAEVIAERARSEVGNGAL